MRSHMSINSMLQVVCVQSVDRCRDWHMKKCWSHHTLSLHQQGKRLCTSRNTYRVPRDLGGKSAIVLAHLHRGQRCKYVKFREISNARECRCINVSLVVMKMNSWRACTQINTTGFQTTNGTTWFQGVFCNPNTSFELLVNIMYAVQGDIVLFCPKMLLDTVVMVFPHVNNVIMLNLGVVAWWKALQHPWCLFWFPATLWKRTFSIPTPVLCMFTSFWWGYADNTINQGARGQSFSHHPCQERAAACFLNHASQQTNSSCCCWRCYNCSWFKPS